MTLFAEADAATIALYGAITAVLMAIANGIQSRLKDRKDARIAAAKKLADEKDAAEKAAALKAAEDRKAAELKRHVEEQAEVVASKTAEQAKDVKDTVAKALNGEGLGGKIEELGRKMDAMGEWQKAHDVQDNQRHDDMLARVLGLKKPGG